MGDDIYYGRCDACGGHLIDDVGLPAVRIAQGMEVTFRFCSDGCKQRFFDRDDATEIPDIDGGLDDA